jgi:hypothetical protein
MTTDDICPRCGDWVLVIDDVTGWCCECGGKTCIHCGESQPIAEFRAGRNVCRTCKAADERARRAASIDHYRARERRNKELARGRS